MYLYSTTTVFSRISIPSKFPWYNTIETMFIPLYQYQRLKLYVKIISYLLYTATQIIQSRIYHLFVQSNSFINHNSRVYIEHHNCLFLWPFLSLLFIVCLFLSLLSSVLSLQIFAFFFHQLQYMVYCLFAICQQVIGTVYQVIWMISLSLSCCSFYFILISSSQIRS